ncbi:UPF0104 family protein [Psychrobacter sp. I-STPA6b]|uniref:UPF0104 family protein n=1 Tax=Psychrobacter sp. I-STPA6b TaxID=2585718 RepID=UPI001D0C6F10|nr:UPF0104 family protein [Psychrobacter sp. I-STPA6b]
MSVNTRKLLWHGSIFLLTLMIFVLAIKALYGLTQSISLDDVWQAIDQIPNINIFFAVLVVAFGYLILTLYDAIALKHMGSRLPFRKIAFTSFTAYAIGHTIGLAVLSASGVRYRMYRVSGVQPEHIANVIWLVSMAFTFGISTLVALSLAFNPDALIVMLGQLDEHLASASAGIPSFMRERAVIQGMGIAMLVAILSIIVWSGKSGRHVKIRGWRFDLPPSWMLIQQIVISIIDLASVAFVLYLLLPQTADISFIMVFSAFIQSMILAILSHVPGGLGVFEVTMIASLPQVDKPYLLAVLLLFRLLYYILPFLLAVLFFIIHEIWLRLRER